MTFLWPKMLWLLLAIPVLVSLYLLLLRRKKKAAVRYANLSLVKAAMGSGPGFRRHVPPLVFLGALAVIIVSVARPAAVVTLPSQRGTIILAMDVSGSMRAEDVDPSRIEAAQAAAKAFIAQQTSSDTKIGIVAFSGTAFLVQPPTDNHEELNAAIDRFQLQRGTAIGSGLLVALQTIFPGQKFDFGTFSSRGDYRGGGRRNSGVPLGQAQSQPEQPELPPVPPGSHKTAVIVLMTDGRPNGGIDPVEAARLAANRGVRVYTVGFGSNESSDVGFGRGYMRTQIDEELLKTMADLTRGKYFHAGTSTELKEVYESLSSQFVMEKTKTEITAFFTAAAAALTLISAMLSLMWFNRII